MRTGLSIDWSATDTELVNDVGRVYLVEKPDRTATVTVLDGEYHNEVFVFNRPLEEVDNSVFVDEETVAMTT